MRIYVAGPYTADNPRDTQLNVNKAIEVGVQLMRKGHAVFIPHLTHYVWLHPDGDFDWKDWLAHDFRWLEQCEALYFIMPSPGADMERRQAEKLGLTIFRRMEDVPDVSE